MKRRQSSPAAGLRPRSRKTRMPLYLRTCAWVGEHMRMGERATLWGGGEDSLDWTVAEMKARATCCVRHFFVSPSLYQEK